MVAEMESKGRLRRRNKRDRLEKQMTIDKQDSHAQCISIRYAAYRNLLWIIECALDIYYLWFIHR